MNKRLLIFAVINTTIIASFYMAILKDPNVLYAFIFIIPIYLIIEITALVLTLWLGKIKIVKWNIVGLLFSTPLPIFLILFYYRLTYSNQENHTTYEHNANGHRLREVSYLNGNFKSDRKEYWTSVDSVTEENPFPFSVLFNLDSIIYYKDSHLIYKKEFYKNGLLIKSENE